MLGILNIEKEMEKMREYIREVEFCTRKVEQIDTETVRYKVNARMNIITIAVTVFLLVCALLKIDGTTRGICIASAGVVLGMTSMVCILFSVVTTAHNYFYCLVEIGVIASGIYGFIERVDNRMFYPALSLVLLVVMQGFTVMQNIKFKKRIGLIAKALDDIV